MSEILNTLAPVFLLIALGAVLQRTGFFGEGFVSGLNRFAYWIGLPALVFVSLASAGHGEAGAGRLLAALLAGTGAAVLAAFVVARALAVRPEATGTFVQAAFRGNLAYVGLPVLLALPGVPRTAAILALAPMLVVYNAVSVAALVASRHGLRPAVAGSIARETVRNPIILGSVAGAGFHAAGWALPVAAERTLGPLGRMALPAALLCIGAALVTTPLKGNRRVAAAAAAFKAGVSPLMGYAAGRALGLAPGELTAVLVLMACPSATAGYTMVRVLGGDEAVAANAVALSTGFSAVALAAIVAWA